jgi:hypothetical protein
MTELSNTPNPESFDQHQLHSESFGDPKTYADLLRRDAVAKTVNFIESSKIEDWYHAKNQAYFVIKMGQENQIGVFYNQDSSIDTIRIQLDKIAYDLALDSDEAKVIQNAIGKKSTDLFIEAKEEALKIFSAIDVSKYQGYKFNIEDTHYNLARTPSGYTHSVESITQVGVGIGSGLIAIGRNDMSVYRTIPKEEYEKVHTEQKGVALKNLLGQMATNPFLGFKSYYDEYLQKSMTEATAERFVQEIPEGIAPSIIKAYYRNNFLELVNKIVKQLPLPIAVVMSEETMEIHLKTIPSLEPKQMRRYMAVVDSTDPNFKWA